MQSRNTALATMDMTAIARWNRFTTRKVCDDPDAIAREEKAWISDGTAVENRGDGVRGDARLDGDTKTVDPVRRALKAARSGRCILIRRWARDIGRIGPRLENRGNRGDHAQRIGSPPNRTVSPTERPSWVARSAPGDARHLPGRLGQHRDQEQRETDHQLINHHGGYQRTIGGSQKNRPLASVVAYLERMLEAQIEEECVGACPSSSPIVYATPGTI